MHLKKNGFTLIEVLVAILVSSLGLLGLASLQVQSLRNNLSAYHRTQAVQQAYDMSDRMRANPEGVNGGHYDAISGKPTDPNCLSTGCTPAQLALNDAREWNLSNEILLPFGRGTVTENAGVYLISISWDDDRDGDVDSDDPDYNLEFIP